MEKEHYEGNCKYEIEYLNKNGLYKSVKTNSWFKFMKLRLTKKVIYYKVLSS